MGPVVPNLALSRQVATTRLIANRRRQESLVPDGVDLSPAQLVELWRMRPIPVEGGHFAQTWMDEHSSSILFLVERPDFSGLHALPHPEVWFFHLGSPMRMLLLRPDGRVDEPVLGPDVAAGHRLQVPVPPGTFMAAETTGEWSLVGTYMAPPYAGDEVDFGDLPTLLERFPTAGERISRLFRQT
jgi:predicted cupin superfamily sugar epimerase